MKRGHGLEKRSNQKTVVDAKDAAGAAPARKDRAKMEAMSGTGVRPRSVLPAPTVAMMNAILFVPHILPL